MKRIVFLAMPITIAALSRPAPAASKQSGKVTLSSNVSVGGTQLHPGDYIVRWDGSGPDVQVRFLHEGKEVVSVPGTLQTKKSDYEVAATMHPGENGTRVLAEIAFYDTTILLPHSDMSPVNE